MIVLFACSAGTPLAAPAHAAPALAATAANAANNSTPGSPGNVIYKTASPAAPVKSPSAGIKARSASFAVGANYQYRWAINSNSFEGILQYNVNNHRITGQIHGDPIEGFQVGRHIMFYRVCSANQLFEAWISARDSSVPPMISGTFSHQGENTYPWFGVDLGSGQGYQENPFK